MKTLTSLCLLLVFSIAGLFAEERIVDMVIARVDNSIITLSDLESAAAPSLMDIRKNYPESQWEEKFADARQRILMQMIDEYVCVRAARDLEILITDEEVDGQIMNIWKNAGISSEEQFREELKKEGIELDEFKDTIRRQITARRVLQREIYSKVKVTDAEIRQYYDEHKETYSEAGKVRVGLLLLEVKNDIPTEWQVIEQKINVISDRINNGADYAEMVREFSNGPEADKGGDIGFIERGKGLAEFEQAAFSLQIGQISAPFKTRYGWNIIKILEIVEARISPIEDKRAEIERSIQIVKSKGFELDWFEKQRARTFIERKDLTKKD